MDIPLENTVLLKDASHEELQRAWGKLSDKIYVIARVLEERTGIFGPHKHLLARGFFWDEIKTSAMKLQAPFDSLNIDLDSKEQKIIQDCIKQQVAFESQG